MREILFRGKRFDNGEWIEGDLRHGNYYLNDPDIYICVPFANTVINYPVDPETVGQFTGLYDKNGTTKIFEGDIVRYADMYDYNCYLERLDNTEAYDRIDFGDIWTIDEVIYGIKFSYPAFDLRKHDFEVNGLSELQESGGWHYEVIGNVWDDPELLEGKTE